MNTVTKLEEVVNEILSRKNKMLGTFEFQELISQAKSQEEIELYTSIFNTLLSARQEEVMRNE